MSDEASFTLKFTEEGLGAISGELGHLSGNMGNSAVLGGVLGGVLAEVGLKAVEMGAEAVKAVAEIGVEFGKAIVEATDFRQRMELAFSSLLHGSADSSKVLQDTIDLSAKLGMSVEETTDAYRSFLAAQLTPATATALVKMTADLRAAGVAGEETQRVMYTLREINDIGTLQARQLRMLEMAGVSGKLIREELAKSLNMDESGVEKAMSQNKIKSDVAIQAIENAVKDKLGEANLGDAGEKFANSTLSGMWGKLQAAWDKGMLDIGAKVMPVLTDTFKPIFKDLMGALTGDAGKTFIKETVLAVKTLGHVITEAWPYVKAFASGLYEGFKAVLPAINSAMKAIGNLTGSKDQTANMEKLGKAIGYVVGGIILLGEGIALGITWMNQLDDKAGGVGGAIAKMGQDALGVVHWFEEMKDKVLGTFFGLVFSAESLGSQVVSGLVGGIMGGIGSAVAAAAALSDRIVSAVKAHLQIHSPSKVFDDIGIQIPAGMAGGVTRGAPAVHDAIRGMADPGAFGAPSPSMFVGGSSVSNTSNRGGNTIHVNVTVPSPNASPGTRQYADELGASLGRELASVLRAELAPA